MNLYKLDPHVHTSETSACGRIPGGELAHRYKKAGFDAIVITDHFTPDFFASLEGLAWEEKVDRFLAGYREAAASGDKIGISVLLGLELRFCGDPNDYLVYGADRRFLVENPLLLELGLKQFARISRDEGFLIYQAHPFRQGIAAADPALLDGVEVYNANPRHESRNHLAYRLAQDNGLRMLSGSDCHQLEDLGQGGIVVAERVRTVRELIDILREGRIEEFIGIGSSSASLSAGEA